MSSGKDEGAREDCQWRLGTQRRKGAGDSPWKVMHTAGVKRVWNNVLEMKLLGKEN